MEGIQADYKARNLILDFENKPSAKVRVKLSDYGFKDSDIGKIVSAAGQKNNPVSLDQMEIQRIIRQRL